MDMTPQAWPDWYDGKHINEVLFCQQFLDKHPMKCVRGRLFTVDGLIEDEGQIGNLILEEISGVLTSGLSKVVTNLLASIKLQAYSPPLPIETDRIHVSNGTYFIDGSFTVVKSYCNNRLTVAYNPDAPTPKKWLQFLSELLQPEDIPTLQEFLGYIRFRADSEASSKAIYEAYTRWCDDNAQKPMSANRVSSELAQNERLYNVEATNNVHVGGKRVRGFMGIEVVNPLPY